MARCLSKELWGEVLLHYYNPDVYDRITAPSQITKLIEMESQPMGPMVLDPIPEIGFKGKVILPHEIRRETESCEHLKDGQQITAAIYLSGNPAEGFYDLYTVCQDCDQRMLSERERMVICDDCGRECFLAECILYEWMYVEPEEDDDWMPLVCKRCTSGYRHLRRLQREAFAEEATLDPRQSHNN